MATKRKRAKDPSDVLADVEKRAGRWPAGLTVLTGDDLYHLDKAQQALLEGLTGADPSGFGLTLFGGDKVDVAQVVGAARSRGMFDPRRVVLVSELAVLEGDAAPLKAYAERPPADSFLIVRAPQLDQRRQLHKALASSGVLLRFDTAELADERRLMQEIGAMARERKIGLRAPEAMLLLQMTGGDLYRIASELDKLRDWLGDRRQVTAEELRELVVGSGSYSGWELADAVMLRERDRALTAARRLLDRGEEPLKVLGGLAYRARVMLQAKALSEQGWRGAEVLRAVRGAWYFRDELFQGLARYGLDELLGFPARLLAADRTLKSRSIRPTAVIETLADDLTRRDARAGGPR